MAAPPSSGPVTGRALVVGASSGIGAALVRELAREGYAVAAVARREAELAALASQCAPAMVRSYAFDVTDHGATRALFDRAVAELGGLDELYYCAGTMPILREDEYDLEKDREILEVNCVAASAWFNLAAAHFERRRAGKIIGISSVAADRGRRGNPGYCASKAWMDTFLEGLRNRLARYGVCVLTIKPGYIDTPMLVGRPNMNRSIAPLPVDECARSIRAAVRARAYVRYVPAKWGLVGFVIRSIPRFVFTRWGPP